MAEYSNWLQQITKKRNHFFRDRSTIFKAFEFSKFYSLAYDQLVKAQVVDASNTIFEQSTPPGVAVFSFGAPAG